MTRKTIQIVALHLRADEAIVAAWLHADHVTQAILVAGLNPEASARGFRGRPTRRDVGRAVVFLPDYDGAAAAPASMTSEGLLFHGLGYALGVEQPPASTLPPADLLNGLQGLLAQGSGDRRVPVPWIYADREGARDDLRSWFSARPSWLFPETAGLSVEEARRSVGSALGDLKVVQAGRSRIWFVTSVVARPHLGEQFRASVAEAVSDLDLQTLVEDDPETGVVTARFAADLAHASGDPAALSSLGDELVRYAGHQAALRGGRLHGSEEEEVVMNLLAAAASLSRCEVEADGWSRFSPLVVRLAEAWRGAVPILRDVIASLATSAHPAGSDALWKAWLDLRAMDR